MFIGQRPPALSLQRKTKEHCIEPTSPATTTFSSLSWTAEKSTAELAVLLKHAYASLHEKEKDLTLAAEVGHYLLENNMMLQSQYESLLQQQQQEDDTNMQLLSQRKAHQMILDELQDKNMELQQLLEDAQQQTDKLQMVHDKKARGLNHDLTILRDHLERATQKIQELEDDQRCKQQQQQQQQRQQEHDDDDEEEVMALFHRIQQLEQENDQLMHSRQSIQDRLNKALSDVELQQQFNLNQWEDYAQLTETYQRQFHQIAQLNLSLQEHRHLLLSHWMDDNTNTMNNENNDTLMVELEKAWHRDQWNLTKNDDDDDGYSSLPASIHESSGIKKDSYNDHDFSDHVMYTKERKEEVDDGLFGPLDTDVLTSYDLYPHITTSKGLVITQQQQQQQQGMVYKMQRWCRFAIVLTMAVFINVLEGPDVMLETK
ncbi:uncharacterized protein BX664DRAFT_295776 [Halteromyces radiatus]|uniref:uncharacterized protein n=1 Tax=Halteromyces radiatus TaxID=101107 RepID=UPI0022207A16|nr:uncharacterized protein BX664DRAFT_295776 [Halteromyces radiatus]KAI8093843.1 hypothetical protein BX664DRAFT_295776 [Halteromyces radiatus]